MAFFFAGISKNDVASVCKSTIVGFYSGTLKELTVAVGDSFSCDNGQLVALARGRFRRAMFGPVPPRAGLQLEASRASESCHG
jgi:hypothetical protein